jgi:hypothetical protein
MQTIDMKDLKQALDDGQVTELYDNRGEGSFNHLHIAGAKQLSVSDVAKGLPADKQAMLVFY